MSRLYQFISSNALVVLVLLIEGAVAFAWVTYRVFGDNPPDISGGTATAYGAFLAIPPALIKFWQWRREQK